jgi:glycosyltransferase involved in cell wall biosynthesis
VWDEAKNLTLLQEVSSALPWPVVIAGQQRHPDAAWEARARPGGTTRFVGDLPFGDLANRLLRASVFVLPAKYEPFGLGPLEAAQAGCALVLGDIPSLREVWGGAALYVSPHEPAELEATLLRLIDNPHELRAMSASARARSALYSPQRMAKGYLDVYRRLTTATAGGSGQQDRRLTTATAGGSGQQDRRLPVRAGMFR